MLKSGHFPYWLIYLACIGAFFLLSLTLRLDDVIPVSQEVKDPAQSSINFLLEMSKVISGLNTAATGAAAAICVKGKDWSTRWSSFDGVAAMLVFVAAAVSTYGIYLSHMAVFNMVKDGAFFALETGLQTALRLQYYGTLSAIFLLGLVFTRLLEGRITVKSA